MQTSTDPTTLPEPRVVAAGRGTEWLAQGFGLFRLQPGAWIGILLVWIAISAVLGWIGLDIVNSFLNPVFAAGIMLGCDRQARGEGITVDTLFAGFRSGRVGQLLLVTMLSWVIAIVALVIVFVGLAWPVLAELGELEAPDPERVIETIGLARVALLVLAIVTVVLLLGGALWFAPALIVFRHVPALDALRLSFRGCLRNWLPFLVYGAVSLVLLVLAIIPLMLGLLVLLPVLMASVYAGYRDIYPA